MEFKNVFIINCVEETIPHKSSMEDNLEEERRLFYGAKTLVRNRISEGLTALQLSCNDN